jgi:predicted 2-oxoglutarate/Fe(II)-dependent dioxygenase YbiX
LRIRDRITRREAKTTSSVPGAEASPDAAAPHGVDALLRPGFLTDTECTELRAEMDRAPRREGSVRETEQPEADTVDRTGRSATECVLSDETTRNIEERICRVAPQIALHFSEEVAEYEVPHFVAYEPGGFYRPHRDIYPDVELPEPLVRRRLSLVVFLNDPSDKPDRGATESTGHYGGGVLRLSSHEGNDFDPRFAWDVPAERGLLVAFRAATWHEVTPVTTGKRYTVVAILLAPKH